MANYKLNFDGSCWPNPGGTAAYGFILSQDGRGVEAGHGVIGTNDQMSNNVAEFHALWQGLRAFNKEVASANERHTLSVLGDSNLVIQVMNKNWAAKSDKLYYPEYETAKMILSIIRGCGHTVIFDWVPRAENQDCDDLSKAHQAVPHTVPSTVVEI